MANKIFISYKYRDNFVLAIPGNNITTARHYVDKLAGLLQNEDHIYKGENDEESMATLVDATIGSKLGDKIFDSTITIVLISKGMKEIYTAERDQWIPWEISYSLKEQSREGSNSKTNAVLAVVLPDENNSYEYFMTYNPECKSTTFYTDKLFQIIRDNMFNLKNKESNSRVCNGSTIFSGRHSYIYPVKWESFVGDVQTYIDIAKGIRQNINDYNLIKTVK